MEIYLNRMFLLDISKMSFNKFFTVLICILFIFNRKIVLLDIKLVVILKMFLGSMDDHEVKK